MARRQPTPVGTAHRSRVRFARGTNTSNELKGYLIRLADPPLAEDLLQEVFIKAMREGEKFCAFGNPRAWLFQVARNTLPR